MNAIIAVFLGGGLGSLLRYLISLIALRLSANFPIGTLLNNLLASFLLAVFVYLLKDKMHDHAIWRLFLITGFCGGFSTFSTFSYENFILIRNDHIFMALINILVSVLTCLCIIMFLLKDLKINE